MLSIGKIIDNKFYCTIIDMLFIKLIYKNIILKCLKIILYYLLFNKTLLLLTQEVV